MRTAAAAVEADPFAVEGRSEGRSGGYRGMGRGGGEGAVPAPACGFGKAARARRVAAERRKGGGGSEALLRLARGRMRKKAGWAPPVSPCASGLRGNGELGRGVNYSSGNETRNSANRSTPCRCFSASAPEQQEAKNSWLIGRSGEPHQSISFSSLFLSWIVDACEILLRPILHVLGRESASTECHGEPFAILGFLRARYGVVLDSEVFMQVAVFRAGNLFDRMPPKDAAAQGTAAGGGDRLSGLSDRVLLRVMSHLKAWEAVRTTAISKRWRDLWRSAVHLDIRQPCLCCCDGLAPAERKKREMAFGKFVTQLLLERQQFVLLESLRLSWSHNSDTNGRVVQHAIRHSAVEIELSGKYHKWCPNPEYMGFIVEDSNAKIRLRILKLVHVRLDDTTLTQLSSRCTSLEEIELRGCVIPESSNIQSESLKRFTMIKCQILSKHLSVYAPNLASLQFSRNSGFVPWIQSLGRLAASNIKNLAFHKDPECSGLGSCKLQILKLSRVKLDGPSLERISSRCTSLEVLELKECSVAGKEIQSTSLRCLTMISCEFGIESGVHLPNLVSLCCIRPHRQVPRFLNMKFLVTATITLDDSCMPSDSQWIWEDDGKDEPDHDGDFFAHSRVESSDDDSFYESDQDEEDESDSGADNSDAISDESDSRADNSDAISDESDSGADNSDAISDNESHQDENEFDHDVLLMRESKSCTDFKNLKTLSLGEWCITPDLDVLAAILERSPKLENLFLHLDMANKIRVDFDPGASSFVCTNLKKVEISCCKHDKMVHILSEFFLLNSIPHSKISNCWTACTCDVNGATVYNAKRKAQTEAEKRPAKQMKADEAPADEDTSTGGVHAGCRVVLAGKPPPDAMAADGAAAQGTSGGGGGDRLSDLPDGVLHRVMSHLKAWEAVRTCVLSKRWRGLWASASRLNIRRRCPCADLPLPDGHDPTVAFATLVHNLLRGRRRWTQLRLCWSHEAPDGNADAWIAYAVRHRAQEIELSARHHYGYPSPEHMSVNARLKILKLTHIQLDDATLTQLCSRCVCLQELELNDCQIPDATRVQATELKHLTMVKCAVPNGLLVYAPNLVSLCCGRSLGYVPWIENLGSFGVVNRMLLQKFLLAKMVSDPNAYLRTLDEYPEYSDVVYCNLKILKLSYVHLDDIILRQLCSRCTSLEGLELKDCSVEGSWIGSTSLKYLTMIRCRFAIGFRVHAPRLVLLRCIRPFQHFPQIQKMEFLVTAAIVLDDSCFQSGCQWPQQRDVSDDDSTDEFDCDSSDSKHSESDHSSSYYDSDRSSSSDEDDNDCTLGYGVIANYERKKAYNYLLSGHKHSGAKPVKNYGEYGSKDSVNFGGAGMLCSLSHVKTMDLLAHPGEVQVLLMRELKSCTDFKNLKTLSLGEWCLTPFFDVLATILGHSPNLESLFFHLDLVRMNAYNSRIGFYPRASSFVCTNLKMVEITCCKHDVVVHRLAEFFRENSIPNERIFVHWTACSGCRGGIGFQGKRKSPRFRPHSLTEPNDRPHGPCRRHSPPPPAAAAAVVKDPDFAADRLLIAPCKNPPQKKL
ncbi:LOW QUALITY PROTEIN: hypothetical protein U9M48_040465 [Paspalum notatum var. saurae]|uniref:F-box domain-containing protein n=1 Tax=Paspalum notatum var. saurae TaxID=547442 RepID=A0AAQ3XD84_PASNO